MFTDYLAVYAAVLSTLVFAWNIRQARPRLRVDLLPGVEGTDEPRFGYYITIRNASSHVVHVAAIGVMYPYVRVGLRDAIEHFRRFRRLPRRLGWVHASLSHHGLNIQCPVSIEARNSHSIFIPEDCLARILAEASERQLIAYVQDQMWKNVYSRVMTCPEPAVREAVHS